MTYMSIKEALRKLEADRKLHAYQPARTRRQARRRAFLAAEALKDFDDPHSAVNMLTGRGYIEAALTRWVSGGLVYGDQRRGRFLVRLDAPPPEIWEVRVTEPVAQARLFCRFPEPDTLVFTKFHTRRHLGPKGSQAWLDAMEACARRWRDLFPGVPPFVGSTIHDYITENCDDFPL